MVSAAPFSPGGGRRPLDGLGGSDMLIGPTAPNSQYGCLRPVRRDPPVVQHRGVIWRGMVPLACPKTRQLCCYIDKRTRCPPRWSNWPSGQPRKAQDRKPFTDNIIVAMKEVLSELKDIAARAGIHYLLGLSRCLFVGSTGLRGSVLPGLRRLSFVSPAATDEDLDRLCCQMSPDHSGEA